MKSTPVFFSFLLCLCATWTKEVATPSSLLSPRKFNHHSYNIKQYLKLLKKPETTKQGPVLFPNDGAPPPRLPLVVTTRPILESIANSDLNTNSANNSVAEQSQISRVAFKPDFLARYEYEPLAYSVAPLPVPAYEDASYPARIPYAEVVNKFRGKGVADNRYSDYEERNSLPPIYKALSDYAQNKVLTTYRKAPQHDYKIHGPDYRRNYEDNELANGNDDTEYTVGDNYAFSYTVKDGKTGDDFSHRQHSSGSATNGEYRVRLPDGRMQIVSYTADENGYKADVRYDEENNSNQINTKSIDNNNNDHNYKENINRFKDYDNKFISRTNPVNIDYNTQINNNNDYPQRDFNIKQVKDDYFNSYDTSKEYYNDYSAEYPNNYETHRSKFEVFKPSTTPTPVYTTLRPYEEIKDFLTKTPIERKTNYINDRVVEINAPSTPNYSGVTEDVVVIAPKLYTRVRSSTPLVETINTTPKPFIVTPATYLASTIASIKERIRASKPILSNDFLQRINKYLTFT